MEEEKRLRDLESETIYILREGLRFPRPAMLWSMGKDSSVMLWIARKAFFGHIPFPVIHIDTSYKMPEMIIFRDKVAKEWGLDLQISQNKSALDNGMNPGIGRLECCGALKTQALKTFINEKDYRAVFAAIRQDEEGSRGKERIFSPRNSASTWDYREQPPQLWDLFPGDQPAGSHMRIHPILHWSELDIWLYIRKENIPVLPLYFSQKNLRYRSVGCAPCTSPVESNASTIDEIIEELRVTKVGERSGRAQDKADRYAMQKLRKEGYM